MNLSFSTNGWDLSFDNLLSLLEENKIFGLEIHDINAKCFEDTNPFLPSNAKEVNKKLFQHGITLSCIDVVGNIADKKLESQNKKEIEDVMEIASNLKCEYIRLHAFNFDEKGIDDYIYETLLPYIKKAKKRGITFLVETMGLYSNSKRLFELLARFCSDNISALWDVQNTFDYANESPDLTIKNLGRFVKHIHIKDSVKREDKIEYKLLGEGNLPFNRIFNALRSVSYENFISLELNPIWLDDLGDIDIVLPQFVGYMSAFEGVSSWQSRLFYNKSKTGKYIWEKESLIERTFSQVLDKMCEEFPDQIAIKYTTLDYCRTYSEFRDDVDKTARALLALGVKKGDHIAVWATNIPEWFIVFWATTKIGAVLVTVNTAYKIHEIEYLLRQSDTRTLFIIKKYRDCNYQDIINELCPELKTIAKGEKLHSKRLPFLRNVITLDFKQEGLYTFSEMLEQSVKISYEEMIAISRTVSVNDVCNMQYTSGTTGFPKGVMLTHFNVVNNGKCIGDRMDLSTADRMMIQVPMFHCFGMVLSMTACMTHGASIFPLPYYSPKPALACINQERITCFNGVPTMFINLLAHEDFAKTDFSYMRTGIMAGSPCPVAVMQEVVDKMNMKEITIVYGQTEASPGCTMSSIDDTIDVRVNTVGRALPKIECKIVNPETNKEVPRNTVGEFVARGYNVMKGYYKMPVETAETIDEDGWLHTGDLAMQLDNGNFKITGRLKDMIIRGGENLYPKEIEDFLYTNPKVKDVQVVGVPDERYGEEAYAFIIVKDGECLTEQEIRDYCNQNIAKHKVPRYFDFVGSFPMNAAGKILKYKMREDAKNKISKGV